MQPPASGLPRPVGMIPADGLRTLLVPTDFSDNAELAFARALALARHYEASVHLVHVTTAIGGSALSPLRYSPEAAALHQTPEQAIHQMFTDLVGRHDSEGVYVEWSTQRSRTPSVGPAICDFARKERVDLIVMGTQGRHGFQRFLLGSVAEEVVEHAPCAVLTVQMPSAEAEIGDRPASVKRLLVPVDFSSASMQAFRQAQILAGDFGASVEVVHVVERPLFFAPLAGVMTIHDLIPDLKDQAVTCLRRLVREYRVEGVPLQTHVVEGNVVKEILAEVEAREIDLIVLAAHGLTGAGQLFLGSVTRRLVRNAPCPVLVVRTTPEPSGDEAALVGTASLPSGVGI